MKTLSLLISIAALTLMMTSCDCFCEDEQGTNSSSMISVEEDGETVFYSEDEKAFGEIYLGMRKDMVESMSKDSIVIKNTKFGFITEYSNDRLFSFYMQSAPTLKPNKTAQEVASVVSLKYGSPNHSKISEISGLALSNSFEIRGNKVEWGSYWKQGDKFIVIGNQKHPAVYPRDTLVYKPATYSIWLWTFNSSVWESLGGHDEHVQSEKF